jgi:hypothetical protein
MAGSNTHKTLCSGAVAAIISLASVWLASSLALAPLIGA